MENGFSFGDLILSMFWFMLLFAWIWLIIIILSDIFRDTTLSGWAKAAWTLFLIVLPWLGALVYLIARGRSMNERAMEHARRQEAQVRDYVRGVAAPASTADELGKLADLRERGVITAAEYEQTKVALLRSPAATPRQSA
jgi:hypothetical protein